MWVGTLRLKILWWIVHNSKICYIHNFLNISNKAHAKYEAIWLIFQKFPIDVKLRCIFWNFGSKNEDFWGEKMRFFRNLKNPFWTSKPSENEIFPSKIYSGPRCAPAYVGRRLRGPVWLIQHFWKFSKQQRRFFQESCVTFGGFEFEVACRAGMLGVPTSK